MGSGVPFGRPVGLAFLTGNEVFIVDRDLDAVLSIDPNTGNRRLVSGCAQVPDPCPIPLIGGGLGFVNPVGIAILNPTSLLVTDIGTGSNALVQVDMVTGNRTVISSATVGSGPAFIEPLSVVVSALGEVFVIDEALDAVVEVDPLTGARSIISGCTEGADPCPTAVIGSGPAFLRPISIASEASGTLVVTDVELGAVLRVNTATGNRTLVSDTSTGQGPIWFNPVGIAVESSGMILVADASRKSVFRVDPVSGNRSVVSKQIDVIVSPSDSVYTSGQNFDLALIVDGAGTISDLSVILDDNDVTAQFTSCSSEVSLRDGGMALQCPDANAVFNLQPGRHLLRFLLFLSVNGTPPREFNQPVRIDILATQ
jgi:hypothetical protein